eukprot:scaffold7161_cov133-Cylindrotheca_fusiformis.AAC.4
MVLMTVGNEQRKLRTYEGFAEYKRHFHQSATRSVTTSTLNAGSLKGIQFAATSLLVSSGKNINSYLFQLKGKDIYGI